MHHWCALWANTAIPCGPQLHFQFKLNANCSLFGLAKYNKTSKNEVRHFGHFRIALYGISGQKSGHPLLAFPADHSTGREPGTARLPGLTLFAARPFLARGPGAHHVLESAPIFSKGDFYGKQPGV
jgi:hypothetical protein